MKKQRRIIVIEYHFDISEAKTTLCEIQELPNGVILDLILSSTGGNLSIAELLSVALLNALKQKRISELNLLIVEECSSSAIDFAYSLRDVANIYVASAVNSIIHKLSFPESSKDESEIESQRMAIDMDTKSTLAKFSQYLERKQIASFKKGADITLKPDQLLKILKAKPIYEWV